MAWLMVMTLAGIGLLYLGGEGLIRGAVVLASRMGLSPLVIGLTVVGFGTSAPELVVSVGAALEGQPDLAVGNVVGSNIANLLLILGLSAVIHSLSVQRRIVYRDGMVMLVAAALLCALAVLGEIGRLAGGVLFALLLLFLADAYRSGRSDGATGGDDLPPATLPLWAALGLVAGGLGLLVGGASLLVEGASGIARAFGVPEAVIGLTLVAVGTSLPELATSIIAALRGHADVAVGNVVGSNIFNILGILGVTALVAPLPVAARMAEIDVWVMLGTTLVALACLRSGWRLSRGEGAVFLAAYGIYTWTLFA